MSIATELTKLQTNLTNAYTAVSNKGGTIPEDQTFANLDTAISSISTGGGSATIDSLIITPTTSQQTITASENIDGYNPITVNAVTSSIDINITPGNIKSGITILGVTGTVEEPAYFPAKVLNITTIVCNNSARDGYMYSGLAHLEGGMVVPFSYDKTNLVWHLNDAVNTTSTKLNGAVYKSSSGSWIPVYAYDSPDMLEYVSESNHNVDSQSYPDAKQMNWDEGHKVNGHASVTTSRLSFTVGNGVVSATDTYTGASLGSWTYHVDNYTAYIDIENMIKGTSYVETTEIATACAAIEEFIYGTNS